MECQSKKDKIICIGNRLIPEDALAMAVYDLLTGASGLYENIDIIEGGIAGLNLLCHLEDAGNVVFVDTVSGFTELNDNDIVVLNQEQITSCLNINSCHYGHDSGIAYLLSVLPMVCEGALPESVFLVGLEMCYPGERRFHNRYWHYSQDDKCHKHETYSKKKDCGHELIKIAADISIEIAMNGNNSVFVQKFQFSNNFCQAVLYENLVK
ncbi:MAG: hypothetical protein HQK65_06405 [Desulfamplus sp.]|nr:hypothetical protein [Desulfamplus sp.]